MSVDDQVREFHAAAECHIASELSVPSEGRLRNRGMLIVEEMIELLEAMGFDNIALTRARLALEGIIRYHAIDWSVFDLAKVAKESADVDYVVAGMRVECGIPGAAVANEVHRSNMSKCTDGRILRRADGKVLKGPNYSPADIAAVLR